MKKLSRQLIALLMLAVLLFTTACGTTDNTKTASDTESTEEAQGAETDSSDGGEYVVSDVSFRSTVGDTDTNNIVFYQIFVGSFSDSDGDGIGDLRGIINRFDYLNDGDPESGKSLGVQGIWLSPIFESPSYHKYDVTDYYTIDPDFGTMDDLKELVELCHERGVKIILDMVINHTGSKNEWFSEFCSAHSQGDTSSQYYDFYTWNSTGSVDGRTFKKISGSDDYYECNFSSDMPELNYDNDAVRQAVLDIADYYLTDIDVDGFRFDAAKYIYYGDNVASSEFWDWYIGQLKEIKSDLYTVAEVWDSDGVTIKYESALNCFDFTMGQAEGQIVATAKKGNVNSFTSYVESYLNNVQAENEDATIIPFIANHDMDRAAGFANVSTGVAFVAANLYILGPGSPFIYYGEEIGMKGSRGSENTDANRRLAMLWGDDDTVKNPEGATYSSSDQSNGTVADQISEENSLYTYYKKLIMIRQANPEIAKGTYQALEFTDTKVGGFVSTYEGSSVCVIHNTTGNEQTVDLADVTDLSFDEINAVVGSYIDNTPSATLDGTKLTISAQTSVVLRQE